MHGHFLSSIYIHLIMIYGSTRLINTDEIIILIQDNDFHYLGASHLII